MKLFYTDHFELPLPDAHRFPMAKYRLLREAVLASSWARRCELRVPAAATDEQLSLAHTPVYVQRVIGGLLTSEQIRRIGFPWSTALVERSRRSAGATIAAGRSAISEGVSVNMAGGTHHASAECGEGFCVFNDVAVAVRTLQQERLIRRALVIDCDVHQGNGTAAIFAADPSVFTFSIHSAKNFPLRKHPSDLDLALADGAGDAEYLQGLRTALDTVFAEPAFDITFYLAGADPYQGDRLGRLRLTMPGLEARDRMVLAECRQRGVPTAIAMAGGYAPQISDIVAIHLATIRVAAEFA